MNSSGKRILRGFTATALNQGVMIAIQLAFVPLLATHWGLSQYGAWLMMATIPTYLSLTDFGFATAAGTDMIIKIAQKDFGGANATFRAARVMVLASTGLLCVTGLTFALLAPEAWLRWAGALDGEQTRRTIALLIIYSALCVHMSVFAAALRSDRRYAISMTIYATTFLAEGLLGGAVVLIGGGTVALAGTFCLARLMGVLAMAATARTSLPWLSLEFRGLTGHDLMRLARPSLAALAMPLAQSLSLQGAVLAVGLGAGPVAVALFSTVRTATRVGLQLATLITNPLLPEFSAAFGRGDRGAQFQILGAAVLSSLVVVLPVGAVLVAAGPQLIGAWTHGTILAPSGLILPLALAMALQGLWASASGMVVAMNRQARFSYRFLLACVLSVPLTFIMAKALGAAGGACAALIVDCVMLGIVWRTVAREIGPIKQIAVSVCGWVRRSVRHPQKMTVW